MRSECGAVANIKGKIIRMTAAADGSEDYPTHNKRREKLNCLSCRKLGGFFARYLLTDKAFFLFINSNKASTGNVIQPP